MLSAHPALGRGRGATLIVALLASITFTGCASGSRPASLPDAAGRCTSGVSAPDVYEARVITSKGPFVIEVHREWAPLAADRFHELVCAGFYSQSRFYRVVKGFIVQFGMSADPVVYAKWQEPRLRDEPALKSNRRGMVAITSSAAPNSRTTHVFINLADNAFLDATSAAPFGIVTSGMDVVDSIYGGYGDNGPDQTRLWAEGNPYLLKDFPELDFITEIALR
jgi:peptidyl-prolyl cis-trans isomerase A (cyclophilin A)